MTERTMFLSFDKSEWDPDEVQQTVDQLSAVVPSDTTIIALEKNIEPMGQDEVAEMVEVLTEALD